MSSIPSAEERVFEDAYVAYADAIERYLYWRTHDQAVAQDLCSETFHKAWKSRAQFKGGSYRAWLYRIAGNILIDYWRKQKDLTLDEAMAIPSSGLGVHDSIVRNEFDRELMEMVAALPDKLEAVLTLRFIEGLSAHETAMALDVSEVNVRVLQYRALRKIRKEINDREKSS